MNQSPTLETLDDARALLADPRRPDDKAAAAASAREPQLTKPPGSLGRLEELSRWLAAWQGRHPPSVERPQALVFAGNHGVAQRGVSAWPSEVTAQMVANFEAGGAAVNQLCRTFGVDLGVHALDLDRPTRDMVEEPAMEADECARAMAQGMEAVDTEADLLCLGEMGIGNTTAAAALCHALHGGEAADWVGPGTGVEGSALAAKIEAVAEAVRRHGPAMTDALEVLRHLGGRELAAIAGAVLAARLARVPVVLDGYVCTAAAAVLESFTPGALDHCQVGHVSSEPGHRRLLRKLDKRPLLDLEMRLGEASGAVLATALVRAAAACHSGMATFAGAGVSDRADG